MHLHGGPSKEALRPQNKEGTPDQTRADNSSHRKPTLRNKGHRTTPAEELPPCLSPRCKGRHYMNGCSISSPDEKKKLLKKVFHEWKKTKENKGS